MNRLDSISFGKIVQIREHLLKLQAGGKKVYRLESGDPSFSIAPHITEAINKALKDGKTHYIPNDGIPDLRKALAQKLHFQNNIKVTENDIYVTNGAMHALFVVFQCMLAQGDEVIVPEPLWTEIGDNIRLAGGVTVSVPLTRAKNYQYSYEDILNKITPKTKAIFVNSPQNPSGAIVPKEELRKIANLAAERGLWLVADEAYEDLVYEGEHYSPASGLQGYDKAVSLYSFSKTHAMSGLRVGYIVTTNPMLKERIPKLLRCTVNGINSISQWGALAAVTGPRDHLNYMLSEYKIRREIMYNAAAAIPGLIPFKPQGAFYLWCDVEPELLEKLKIKSVSQLSDFLAECGIGSAPGDCFGESCANGIRFAFSCSTEMVTEGSAALKEFLTRR
ncbi:pyridoxal phosphate-dependent aminotransferase [Fluviispira vulneris]|uniref:pyridoxal phosphate-dependent aminotransferase n=1 Tax=Fluviispira vulneris TaxID=2763012 RepID=UPI00164932EF|nr:pyridoxal phosphate-dependent aminotransferase [Fluviispira vulneris]